MSEQPHYAHESSSSSRSSPPQEIEDDITIGRILAEANHNNDRSLGKRLSHLDSIPHTPRVNGQIPDVDNATLDHERLLERLSTYGLAELQVEGDGNCQFRALADQLFRNPEYHKHVRKGVVKQLKQFRKLYEGYVPMEYKTYLKKMKRSGEWGDNLTLQAAADRFGAKICLLTSFRDNCLIEIMPRDQTPTKVNKSTLPSLAFRNPIYLISNSPDELSSDAAELWLSFWSEVHYNSLYESDDLPTRLPRKKHWLF